jgi:hypothetical protein
MQYIFLLKDSADGIVSANMIEAVKVLEQAAILATYDHEHHDDQDDQGAFALRLANRADIPGPSPAVFAREFRNEFCDVLPAATSLVVSKGLNHDGEFVDYGKYNAAESKELLVARFALAFTTAESNNGGFSWHLRLNDYRQPTENAWEQVRSSLHTLDIVLGEAPTVGAWQFGMQGQWSEIEPRISAPNLAATVMCLACLPDVLQDADKYRADKTAVVPKFQELDEERTRLKLAGEHLSEKELRKLSGFEVQLAQTGFSSVSWRRQASTAGSLVTAR